MGVKVEAQATTGTASPHTAQSRLNAFFHSKLFMLILIILAGMIGYLIAPPDLAVGDYEALMRLNIDGQSVELAFPFAIGREPGSIVTVSEVSNGIQITIEGLDAIQQSLGERIFYRVSATMPDGTSVPLQLEQATSTLRGSGYEQVLPPTRQEGDSLGFSMRIPFSARITTGLLFAVAALWLTEIVPLSAGALLIPVVIVIAGVTDPNTVLAPFFDKIIVLFLAGFLMAEAMRRTGVDRLIALAILRNTSTRPALLMLTMMGITAFLSMWMSNTASVAIIIPIALAILDKVPNGNNARFSKALILGVAYAGAMGGIGSAIGTPANMLALSFLSKFGETPLSFNDWFAYGMPMVLVMVPIIWLYLLLTFRVSRQSEFDRSLYAHEIKAMGPVKPRQILILVVFAGVVALWLTESIHHVHSSIIALSGALVLILTELIHKEDLNRINWDALLTFGGGLSIGSLLVMTGVSDWVALRLIGLATLPPLLVIFLVAGLTMIIGAFISNTACAAMLIPLAIPLAQILHLDPRLMVGIVAISSSIDFALVVGTPPTMMAYSTGYFDTSEIFKRGIVLDIIGVTVLSFGIIWIWQLLGVASF